MGSIGRDMFNWELHSFQLALQKQRRSCSCNQMHHFRSLFMHATLVDGPAVVPLFCISIQLLALRVVLSFTCDDQSFLPCHACSSVLALARQTRSNRLRCPTKRRTTQRGVRRLSAGLDGCPARVAFGRPRSEAFLRFPRR